MITLCMDTAYKYLTVGLYEDGKLLAGVSYPCFKKQSENLFPEIEAVLKEAGKTWNDIGECVITDGPGSYTGVRIAMTVAKVLCSQRRIPLYLLSTLQLYAGTEPSANVLLDARSHRAYAGHVENGELTAEETILTEDQYDRFLADNPGTLYGDELAGIPAPSDFLKNFMDLRPQWRLAENVHAAVPRYLKESDAYSRQPGK